MALQKGLLTSEGTFINSARHLIVLREYLAFLSLWVNVGWSSTLYSFIKLILHDSHVILELVARLHEYRVLHELLAGVPQVLTYNQSIDLSQQSNLMGIDALNQLWHLPPFLLSSLSRFSCKDSWNDCCIFTIKMCERGKELYLKFS